MEAASGPHFSGLRLDALRSSPSSLPSPRSAPVTPTSSAFTAADPSSPKQPFVIGVSGGTASGKTTVCDMIIQQLHDHHVVLVNRVSKNRITVVHRIICLSRSGLIKKNGFKGSFTEQDLQRSGWDCCFEENTGPDREEVGREEKSEQIEEGPIQDDDKKNANSHIYGADSPPFTQPRFLFQCQHSQTDTP